MSRAVSEKKTLLQRAAQYLPILQWLPDYQLSWLRADILAGITVWAVMVPEAMAYSGIAGVPPLVGLYTVPIPLIVYALMGTSRTMVIGPDSATALISAGTVGAIIASQSGASQISEYVALSSALALLVGIIFLVLGLARMGWVANFIPTPVMKGFIQGLVWVTIIGQVPKLFGIEGEHGNFFAQLWAVIHNLSGADPITTAIGLGSLLLLAFVKHAAPKLPSALTAVVVSIVIVTIFDLGAKGVDIVGQVKTGLPELAMPEFTLAQMQLLIPGALAIVLLGYAETLGAAKAASAKNGGTVDPNQELVNHGPANIGSALSGGFVVVGSLSKTSVAMEAGGKTQIAALVHALLIILTLIFLLPLFTNLPHAALAAIVIEAMLGLLDFSYLKRLWRQSPWELLIAMVAYLGVMAIGVLPGMAAGIALSILLLIYRASSPPCAMLGRAGKENSFHNILRYPDLITVPGLLIFRFDANLFFANANHFHRTLQSFISQSETPVSRVLIDAEGINLIDTTGAEMLLELQKELSRQGITLTFARVHDAVKDRLQTTGVVEQIGSDQFYETLQEGMDAFIRNQKPEDRR